MLAVDRLCSFLEKTIADTPGGSPRVMLAGLHASVQEEVRVIAGAFSLTWLHASSVLYVSVADALAAAKEVPHVPSFTGTKVQTLTQKPQVLDGGGVAAADLESAAAEAEKMKPSEVARRWFLEEEARQQTLSAGPASSAAPEVGGGPTGSFEMHEI